MPSADRQFIVPCECSAGVPVTAGQAGGQAVCSACGRSVDVPRLRELVRGTEASTAPGAIRSAPAWNVARGVAVAGAAVAVVAALAALAIVPVGSRFFPRPAAPEVIRAAAKAAPIGEVLDAWRSMATTGVQRPPTLEEQRLQQFTATGSRIAGLLWALAAAGAGLAVAGVVAGRQDHASAHLPSREHRT